MKKFITALFTTTMLMSATAGEGPEPKDSFLSNKVDSISREMARQNAQMKMEIQSLRRDLNKNTQNDKSWQSSMMLSLNGKSDEAKNYTDEMFNKAVAQNTGTEEQLTIAIKKQEVRIDSLTSWQKTVNAFIAKKQNQIGKTAFVIVAITAFMALVLSIVAIWMALDKKRRSPKPLDDLAHPKFKTAPHGDNRGETAGPKTFV